MSQREVTIVGKNNTKAEVTGQNELKVQVSSIGPTSGLASEATLAAIESNTSGVARTPTFLRPTGANGTVTAGTFSMSFASVGTGNAIVGGIILKPGETLNFDAGALNNTLGAVAYDTTTNAGAELIIITLT